MALSVKDYQKSCTKPVIAVGMGPQGQLSRVLNPITFVTHPRIPSSSAPGQLSLAMVSQCRHLIGQIPQKPFFIFGNNISHSLSPTIHNAAFTELGLPHHYSIYQTPQVDESVSQIVQRADFGGASVTFPHKLQVQPLLHTLSNSAKAVGAINTIVVDEDDGSRHLRGDNTDWLGVLNCMNKCSTKTSQGPATVIGAGDAARAAVFALQSLGFRRLALVNRTATTAECLANDFPTIESEIYHSLSASPPANIIVGCIPADDVRIGDIPEHIFAGDTGIIIEMSYKPVISALMKAASKHSGWQVMGGIDVLREQAYAQFELWTGRRAPVKVIEAALREKAASGS